MLLCSDTTCWPAMLENSRRGRRGSIRSGFIMLLPPLLATFNANHLERLMFKAVVVAAAAATVLVVAAVSVSVSVASVVIDLDFDSLFILTFGSSLILILRFVLVLDLFIVLVILLLVVFRPFDSMFIVLLLLLPLLLCVALDRRSGSFVATLFEGAIIAFLRNISRQFLASSRSFS